MTSQSQVLTTVRAVSTLPLNSDLSYTPHPTTGAAMGDVVTQSDGYISEINSTELNLAAGETFEGVFDSAIDYGGIRVLIYASHASASRGLEFWCSKDGTNGFVDDSYTIPAATSKTFTATIAPYFKIRYTNGGTQTTTLKICTIFSKNLSVPSSHRIGDTVTDDDDAQLVQAILKAQRPGGDYTNIDATNGGNLKVSVEEFESGISVNNNTQLRATLFDSDGNEVSASGGFNLNLNLDSFERLRVAGTGTRSDADFIMSKRPLEFDDISGGNGSATFQANSRDVLLATGGSATSDIGGMRQHFPAIYTAGNGQLIIGTGVPDYANLGGTMHVFLRSSISGTPTYLVRQAQSGWDAATSGQDWQYSHIFGVDFQSLRVGLVRFYMDINGQATTVYEQPNDNVRNSGYWQSPHLPPYARLYNTATETIFEIGYGDEANAVGFQYVYNQVEPTAKAVYICTTVKSEGGRDLFDLVGLPFVARNYANPLATTTVSTTAVPVISFRVASLYNALVNRTLYLPSSYTIKTDNPIFYRWMYRPTLTGASWQNIDTATGIVHTGLEYDVSATAVTGGYEIDADYLITTRNTAKGETGLLGRTIMALGYGASADIISLVAVRDGNNDANVSAILRGELIR